MSEYPTSFSRVYANDMSPSPSPSDSDEHDAVKSPLPTTPQEHENLMEGLHAALGEALLEQVEIEDGGKLDSETEHSQSENASRLVGAEYVSSPDVVHTAHHEVVASKQVADGNGPLVDDTDKQTHDTAAVVAGSTGCTNSHVGGRTVSVPYRQSHEMPRGVNVSPAVDVSTNVTTGYKQEHTSKNITLAVSGGDSAVAEESQHQQTIDPVLSILQMPPNAVSISSAHGMSTDSDSPARNTDESCPDSRVLNDAKKHCNDGSEEKASCEESQNGNKSSKSSEDGKASSSTQDANYSLWGESAPELLLPKEEEGTSNSALSPLGISSLTAENDRQRLSGKRQSDAEEQVETDEKEVSIPSSSRRLPIFESMAAEERSPSGDTNPLEVPSDGAVTADITSEYAEHVNRHSPSKSPGDSASDARLKQPVMSPTVDFQMDPVSSVPPTEVDSPSSFPTEHIDVVVPQSRVSPAIENRSEVRPSRSPTGSDPRNVPIGTPLKKKQVLSLPLSADSASGRPVISSAVPQSVLSEVPQLGEAKLSFPEEHNGSDQEVSQSLGYSESGFGVFPASIIQGDGNSSQTSQQPNTSTAIMPLASQSLEDAASQHSYVVVTNSAQVVPQLQERQAVTYGAFPLQTFPKPVMQAAPSFGRRKIRLRLEEDVRVQDSRRSWFSRSRRTLSSPRMGAMDSLDGHVDRGTIAVSWYEGTTSAELQEHVKRSVVRKMGLQGNIQLLDLRVIDESMDPPEEIVLSSYIPDGSQFLLRFGTKDLGETPKAASLSRQLLRASMSEAPVSPSAALSPYPSSADLPGLSATQLSALGAMPLGDENRSGSRRRRSKRDTPPRTSPDSPAANGDADAPESPVAARTAKETKNRNDTEETDASSKASGYSHGDDYPEDPIEARLRQITELLLLDRGVQRRSTGRREEKKQVIFVLANYFVLFLSLIAISAEIQARAPTWMHWLENQMESVQQCANDRDALFECVSNGDISGLIASFILWLSRSAATKRIFLFGFESPKRLWTVVYEALVTAFCWGTSYTFIRRGMNPDTRRNFLQKYWKDAVYGSLAGFNASFMKAVLKNLIPQEAFENALDDRELRLKIFSWLPSFH